MTDDELSLPSDELTPTSWVAVSRGALTHNAQALLKLLETAEPAPRLIAVVKANAYGHGAPQTARVLSEAGIDFFAVTTPEEALELRLAGIAAEILAFAPPIPDQVKTLVAQGIVLTVCDLDGLAAISKAAASAGKSAKVHLKVDTGMGRLGVLPANAVKLARAIADDPNVTLGGVYTHFGRALEKDEAPTRKQLAVFLSVLQDLKGAGIDSGLRHCANSAGVLLGPDYWMDAVRPGTLLYGQYPAASLPKRLELRDSWKLKTRIVSVRDVPAGTPVGYGGEFVTARATRLAVLPIGYADGFTVVPGSVTSGARGLKALLRGLMKRGAQNTVTICGKRVPVVGRVAMQICSVDVTDLGEVAVGDEVTVPARRVTSSARLPRRFEDG
ncbi:alanine racemase [Capsulimonas corticalis]|uniref:Alanine racemase n=1 Tax=Capsulimonas corticalis TaxID=2219043 RepID=A0A402CVJ5_9BACT|nr:alanine racemase [Capsulimonas corticalis]BDI30423.1 alanine racemase [Capsulimonas corticalis]